VFNAKSVNTKMLPLLNLAFLAPLVRPIMVLLDSAAVLPAITATLLPSLDWVAVKSALLVAMPMAQA
jgi:hypothetical protein